MKRKIPYELEKITLNIRKGDFSKLQLFFPRVGASHAIREMIRAHVERVEAKLKAKEEPNV